MLRPSGLKEIAADRPRATFQSVRETIDLALPANILGVLQK